MPATGLYESFLVWPLWYLSAMLILLPLFYSAMLKCRNFFLYVLCPVLVLLIYGWFSVTTQHIDRWQDWNGLFFVSLPRAWAGLSLGGLVYCAAKKLKSLKFTKQGRLPYRSLRFEWKYTELDSFQPVPVVAYPQEAGYTRITEYRKLPVQKGVGSSYAVEYPLPYKEGEAMEPYYPVLTTESQKQYEKYKTLADNIPNLICCGRLADFKYYNMDQALERALRCIEYRFSK